MLTPSEVFLLLLAAVAIAIVVVVKVGEVIATRRS